MGNGWEGLRVGGDVGSVVGLELEGGLGGGGG